MKHEQNNHHTQKMDKMNGIENRNNYSDNNNNYKWRQIDWKKKKLQNHELIHGSMLFNGISHKFCKSNLIPT